MTTILLWVLIGECLAIIGWGFLKADRMIQFPFLIAGVFLGWVLPQLIGLTHNAYLPGFGLEKTIFMAILCLGAAWWGYNFNRRLAKLFWWRFDRGRLAWGSALLSLSGAYFFYQVSLIAAEVTAATGGGWTGIITIYVFFAKLLIVGMAVALILHLSKPSWFTLGILLFDLAFYLHRIIVQGRRAWTVQLGLMVLLALWFQRRWLPPRAVMIAVIIVGALAVNSIGEYRRVMLAGDRTTWSGAGVDEVLEIDYVGNLQEIASGDERASELYNAVFNIEAADRQMRFDFGLSNWNSLIFQYVPAQLLGQDFKRSLMAGLPNLAYEEFRHVPYSGTTYTGLSDAFLSFWYLGAIKFFVIALIMSRWYRAALGGNIVAQIVLMVTVGQSLETVTHSTQEFFNALVQVAVFLLPVLLVARVGKVQDTVRAHQTQASPLPIPIPSPNWANPELKQQ